MQNILSMKSIAESVNDLTFTDYYYRLMLIAKSLYTWKNLPNGISEEVIEKYLFNDGKCCFFFDENLGFMVANYTDDGTLNVYDKPTHITPFATGYTGSRLENEIETIIIKNNDMLLPTNLSIQLFAYRLAQLTRTSDVNINTQTTPFFIVCDEKQKLSFKRAVEKVNDNELAVYGSKNFDIDNFKVLNLNSPIVFDKLTIEKHNVWNECMNFLGINNANQDKRERLVANEVNANNEQVNACGNVFLKARQECCERINKLFNLNISVEMRNIETPVLYERGEKNDKELRTDNN